MECINTPPLVKTISCFIPKKFRVVNVFPEFIVLQTHGLQVPDFLVKFEDEIELEAIKGMMSYFLPE